MIDTEIRTVTRETLSEESRLITWGLFVRLTPSGNYSYGQFENSCLPSVYYEWVKLKSEKLP